ncbi:hypothetical protein FB45DRAFT_1015217 [Roridomyces roridus]|uniref:Uncharacterized protein n=1 Tax=Roridomyces roridus TaxID=1738132 RepID=A0AAD7F7X5_9AGAR|nr:hypothetical protein FB45DRAFT_1015217 [Roridomyces roridus]
MTEPTLVVIRPWLGEKLWHGFVMICLHRFFSMVYDELKDAARQCLLRRRGGHRFPTPLDAEVASRHRPTKVVMGFLCAEMNAGDFIDTQAANRSLLAVEHHIAEVELHNGDGSLPLNVKSWAVSRKETKGHPSRVSGVDTGNRQHIAKDGRMCREKVARDGREQLLLEFILLRRRRWWEKTKMIAQPIANIHKAIIARHHGDHGIQTASRPSPNYRLMLNT